MSAFSVYSRGKGYDGLIKKGNSRGDVVASTLEYYRERTKTEELDTPTLYLDIQKRLQEIKASGKRMLIDIKDSYSTQTTVIQLEYVADRWAMGKSICYSNGQEILVPYTIHYSDILCKSAKIKVITEGDNPYGTKS